MLLSSSVEPKSTWEMENLSKGLGRLVDKFSCDTVLGCVGAMRSDKKLTSAHQAGHLLPADGD
jgi:hypothetical protein